MKRFAGANKIFLYIYINYDKSTLCFYLQTSINIVPMLQ
jgi:hypothetical protein